MRWVTKFNLGIKQVLIQKLGTALEQEQTPISKKGRAFSGWALSGATRRAEQKWMLIERSGFHPFPARNIAE